MPIQKRYTKIIYSLKINNRGKSAEIRPSKIAAIQTKSECGPLLLNR